MILENVKPLMIVWLPVEASLGFDFGLTTTRIGEGMWDKTVDFVLRRTSGDRKLKVAEIPIPFYFYENIGSDKKNDENTTGFLLDSCSENIDVSYPDSPTTQSDTTATAVANLKVDETFIVKNTLDVSFRVKLGSTPVSIFRALMKRVLTNPEIIKNLRFSWFWREYVMGYAKCVDYNEEPISGTDLVMIRIKFQSYNQTTQETSAGSADAGAKPIDGLVEYSLRNS